MLLLERPSYIEVTLGLCFDSIFKDLKGIFTKAPLSGELNF